MVPLPPLAFCHVLHRLHRNDQLKQPLNYLTTQLRLQSRHVIYKNNELVPFQGSSSFLLAEVGSIEAGDNARSDASSEEQHDLPIPLTKTAAVASSEEHDDPSMFFELMSPVASAKPDQMSASSLAYWATSCSSYSLGHDTCGPVDGCLTCRIRLFLLSVVSFI